MRKLLKGEVTEYAGFKYQIYDEDGVPYAEPLEGQHPAANKVKHRLEAVEQWLGGQGYANRGRKNSDDL